MKCINSFEDIMEKLTELLHKLKNFNSTQCNQLTQKGLLSLFNIVLKQDYNLNMNHIFINFCQSIAQFRTSAAIVRINLIGKSRILLNKIYGFQRY